MRTLCTQRLALMILGSLLALPLRVEAASCGARVYSSYDGTYCWGHDGSGMSGCCSGNYVYCGSEQKSGSFCTPAPGDTATVCGASDVCSKEDNSSASCAPAPGKCGDTNESDCNGVQGDACAPCERDCCPSPGGGGGGGGAPTCGAGAAGDPILLGVKAAATHPFDDFGVERVTPMFLTRRYNSADVDFDRSGPGGIFGAGWHHDWEATLSCEAGVCVVRRGLLPGYQFALSGAVPSLDGLESWNVYAAYAPPGYAPPHRNVLVQRPDGTWILHGTDGGELHFQTVCTSCDTGGALCKAPEAGGTARLVKRVDPRGNAAHVEYDGPAGLLLGVRDELGHTLQARGQGSCPAHVSELTYDGAVVARYTITGHLLQQVTDADGKILRAYVNTSFGGPWPRLQAILNESGAPIAEFTYDSQQRAIGAAAADSSVEVSYGEDGRSAVVTEYYRGRFGDTSTSGERVLDWNRRVTSVSGDNAIPPRTMVWTPGGKLQCSRDASGLTTVRDFDPLGRTVHQVQFQGTSCAVPDPLPSDAREEWRSYGVRKAVAQGLDLELDTVTAVSRQSAVSPGSLAGETYDHNPAPESIDPADYTCQSEPLPAGSVVCRQLSTGYVQGASGPVFERHGTFHSYDARARLVRTWGPVDLDRPGAADVPPLEERTYWGDGESAARQGRLREVRRYPSPGGVPLVTTYDYDAFGVYRIVAPDGSSTTIIKDARGRPTFVAQADASGVVRARTETRYYDGHLPRLRVLAGGAAVRYAYDNRGRLQLTEYLSGDPEVSGAAPVVAWSERYEYDQAGNRVRAVRRDRDGRVTWEQDRAFDVQHRVVWESNPALAGAGKSWQYDASGFLTALTDEEGRGTGFTPDGLRRVQKVTRTGLDRLGRPASADVAVYQYGPGQDTLGSVTDGAGRTTGYGHDDFGRVQQVTSGVLSRAGGGVWYRHDARGNVVARGDRTVSVVYTYDGLDRLRTELAQNGTDGSSVAYELRYDENGLAGRLTTIVEPERTVSYAYDWAGLLTTESVAVSGVAAPLVTGYAYDVNGALSRVTYPSGLVVALDRDPATGEVIAVRDGISGAAWASGITRSPGGPITGLTYGNGEVLAKTFNARYEPLTIASGPVSLGYGMTPAGDVGVVRDQSEEAGGCVRAVTRSASYDLQDRLVSWSDAVGSGAGICAPESAVSAPATFTYVSGTEQVASQVSASGTPVLAFGYDEQGNVSAVGRYDGAGAEIAAAMCLRHDALGRMVKAGTTAGSFSPGGLACTADDAVGTAVAEYRYDLANRRVARLRNGVWTHVVPDASGNPLSELALVDGAWRSVRDYVWLDGLPLAQVEYGSGGAHAYYAHLDHLGMPRALTSESGQVVWSVHQRPYGEVVEQTAVDPATAQTVVTNLRLPGQYDERLFAAAGISGLQGPYYNWNRWYLPGVGRYLELDPVALRSEFNADYGVDWYNYALGSPMLWTDSKGLGTDSLTAGLCPPGWWVSFDANFNPVCTNEYHRPFPGPPKVPFYDCMKRCTGMLNPWPIALAPAGGKWAGGVGTAWNAGTLFGCMIFCTQHDNYCPDAPW